MRPHTHIDSVRDRSRKGCYYTENTVELNLRARTGSVISIGWRLLLAVGLSRRRLLEEASLCSLECGDSLVGALRGADAATSSLACSEILSIDWSLKFRMWFAEAWECVPSLDGVSAASNETGLPASPTMLRNFAFAFSMLGSPAGGGGTL